MVTTWAEMKGQLREKFVPACYRSMMINEWQRLRQGEGTVSEYISRFDDLMIRCNIDEEPMATLARFRAGLRSEFQRELVLHEVTSLEKAYRYTLNMEIYATHAQRDHTPWYTTTGNPRMAHTDPKPHLHTPLSQSNLPATPFPSPTRLPLPNSTPTLATIQALVIGGRYRLGVNSCLSTNRNGAPNHSMSERGPEG